MTIKRLLSFLLCVALLLPCIPAVSIAATEPVVYLDSVNGSDDNDGLTEGTAVATLNGAYTALKNNIGTAKRGKVIFVNDYTFEFVKAGIGISVHRPTALKSYLPARPHRLPCILSCFPRTVSV